MKKRALLLFVLMAVLLTSLMVTAIEPPIVYQERITVTEEGGRYQVGFVNVEFKKEFIDETMLPATFDVEVYAENGVIYIEFLPDTPDFFKNVHIRVAQYEGYIYDKATGENIYVNVPRQQIKAEHFSRYAFIR